MRNYEVQNPEKTSPEASVAAADQPGAKANDAKGKADPPETTEQDHAPKVIVPHADAYDIKFLFDDGEPAVPEDDDAKEARPENYDMPPHWRDENREKWQQVSSKGPSYGNDMEIIRKEALQEYVNPDGVDWSLSKREVQDSRFARFWQELRNSSSYYSDKTLTLEALKDDHQCLFVRIVLKHVDELLEAACKNVAPKPLRLFLLGTAGTGKTRATQTLLQSLQEKFRSLGLPLDFIRCGAPTGSAAFDIRFSATTVHRLIHYFNPPHFRNFAPGSDALERFQTHLAQTKMILIDEISMIGRQFMGKIDARLRQGAAGRAGADRSLGGLSAICVGDPAQCEAMRDQQLYDMDAHRKLATTRRQNVPGIPTSASLSTQSLMTSLCSVQCIV